MSVILERGLVYGSHLAGNKVVLEPIIETGQKFPFLDSEILQPSLFRRGILQLNQVLMAHPGVDLNVIYDPVVTVTENYVDFDGFARFGHSYCKIRFPEKLFKGGIKQEGVTNVDFNPRFIRSLRNRHYTHNLWLYIDPDGVELAVDSTSYHLEKIRMPNWWRDAYRELGKYINIETLEPIGFGKGSEQFSKVVLSGKAFQRLVHEVGYSYLIPREGVRSLLWDDKSVELVYGKASTDKVRSAASMKLITPCNSPVQSWGVWRIQNLSDIAEYIIQADVYLAKKQPSFWILHARSGIQLLLGYTPYTSALWTEKAREAVEYLIKHPYSRRFAPGRRPRKRRKPRNKPRSRINFVQMHPGQRKIPDFIAN